MNLRLPRALALWHRLPLFVCVVSLVSIGSAQLEPRRGTDVFHSWANDNSDDYNLPPPPEPSSFRPTFGPSPGGDSAVVDLPDTPSPQPSMGVPDSPDEPEPQPGASFTAPPSSLPALSPPLEEVRREELQRQNRLEQIAPSGASRHGDPPSDGQTSGDTASGDPTAAETGTSLADQNADFGNVSINGLDVVEAWTRVQRLVPGGASLSAREVPIVDPGSTGYGFYGPYQWKGLLAQSLFFNVVENSFRAASDDQIRRLLANKPFWHDYFASTKQFNMRRWNDGDDFLVNYVGHPMQGAVSGFIEIQNDPVGRQLEIGANREYWKSRFKAFLWATAYSTHSEISPLGEAGIGNEGGWTYPIQCKTHGCPQWTPKMHYTNNTGWVDFIITPTVGTLWLLAEDTLDRFISDRVQGGNRSGLGSAFLRGALNPSRSMANAMRFQAPWYRDFQHDPEVENSFVTRPQPSEEDLAELGPLRRISISPFFHAMPFGSPGQPCVLCFGGPGVGIGLDIAITRWISLSLEAERQAGLLAKGSTANGSTASIGYGLRFERESLRSTLSLAVRPGVVIEETVGPLELDEARNTYLRPQASVSHSAVSIVLSNDFKVSKSLAVRYSVGDTIVRYRDPVEDPPGIGKPPYLSWLSKVDYTNKSNWSGEAGPVFRF